jgi:hypothetical protein
MIKISELREIYAGSIVIMDPDEFSGHESSSVRIGRINARGSGRDLAEAYRSALAALEKKASKSGSDTAVIKSAEISPAIYLLGLLFNSLVRCRIVAETYRFPHRQEAYPEFAATHAEGETYTRNL